MSEILNKEMMLTLAATFIFYFTLGGLGAFTKDLYDNFVNGKVKIELPRIFIAAISTSFICIGGQDYLSEYLSLNAIIFLGFLCGVVGFELFGCMNSLKGLKKTLVEIIRIKQCLSLGVPIEDVGKKEEKPTATPSVQNVTQTTDGPSVQAQEASNNDKHDTSHDENKEPEAADDLLSQVIKEYAE